MTQFVRWQGRLKMLMINVFICVSDPESETETLNESTQVVP